MVHINMPMPNVCMECPFAYVDCDTDVPGCEIMDVLNGPDYDVYTPIGQKDKNCPLMESERKKGKWIITSEFEDCYYAKCNQCNITQVFYFNKPLTNFCPNCGSDMRGDQDDE